MNIKYISLVLVIFIETSFAEADVINTSGQAECWGSNSYGQLGNIQNSGKYEPNIIPLPVENLSTGVSEISGGTNHACALISDGSVKCWGRNNEGQLGNVHNSGINAPNNTPLSVQKLKDKVIQISSGAEHTCALLENGDVVCWGSNYYGQLGNAMYSGTSTNIDFPLKADLSGMRARSISSGGYHTCAIMENDSILCWGDNKSLQSYCQMWCMASGGASV